MAVPTIKKLKTDLITIFTRARSRPNFSTTFVISFNSFDSKIWLKMVLSPVQVASNSYGKHKILKKSNNFGLLRCPFVIGQKESDVTPKIALATGCCSYTAIYGAAIKTADRACCRQPIAHKVARKVARVT